MRFQQFALFSLVALAAAVPLSGKDNRVKLASGIYPSMRLSHISHVPIKVNESLMQKPLYLVRMSTAISPLVPLSLVSGARKSI